MLFNDVRVQARRVVPEGQSGVLQANRLGEQAGHFLLWDCYLVAESSINAHRSLKTHF